MNIVLSLSWFIKEGAYFYFSKLQYRVLESDYLSAWLHKVPTKDSLFFQLRDSLALAGTHDFSQDESQGPQLFVTKSLHSWKFC